MSVTRDVVTDLLPVYFSGEASDDTRRLVEEYFRVNPEFEKVARNSATPLEALTRGGKMAARPGFLTDADEREKCDLEGVRFSLQRRKVIFGIALFLTLAPLAFVYRDGHVVWMMARNEPWDAAFYWTLGAFMWLAYFANLSRRMFALITAIFFGLFPVVMHFAFPGGPHVFTKAIPNYITGLFWGVAALAFLRFALRLRSSTGSLLFAIFLTLFPLSEMLYSVLTGSKIDIGWSAFFWTLAAFIWAQYFWLRRKRRG